MNLLAFLSDRCNMTCCYCFLSLNEGPSVVLPLEALKRAIDAHRAAHPAGRVTLLGGEPSMHWELLRGAAAHAGAAVTVVTNGTRLDARRLAELQSLGAQVCVSLDGAAPENDLSRRLLAGGSAHAGVLEALSGAGLAAVRANLVVREATVSRLPASVEALRARGFRSVSCHLDVSEAWTPRGLAALGVAAAGLRRYLVAAGGAVALANAQSLEPQPEGHGYDDVVLGADGRYYPCDGLFAKPYRELGAWSVGDARSGLDVRARAAAHERAAAFIHARVGAHANCPREPYFTALARGADPDAAVRRFHAADVVFTEALCPARA